MWMSLCIVVSRRQVCSGQELIRFAPLCQMQTEKSLLASQHNVVDRMFHYSTTKVSQNRLKVIWRHSSRYSFSCFKVRAHTPSLSFTPHRTNFSILSSSPPSSDQDQILRRPMSQSSCRQHLSSREFLQLLAPCFVDPLSVF